MAAAGGMQKADAMGLFLTSLWSVDEIRGEVQGGILWKVSWCRYVAMLSARGPEETTKDGPCRCAFMATSLHYGNCKMCQKKLYLADQQGTFYQFFPEAAIPRRWFGDF